MDQNFDHQMSLSKSKCWYSNNCLHFLKCAVPFCSCLRLEQAWGHFCTQSGCPALVNPGNRQVLSKSFLAHVFLDDFHPVFVRFDRQMARRRQNFRAFFRFFCGEAIFTLLSRCPAKNVEFLDCRSTILHSKQFGNLNF